LSPLTQGAAYAIIVLVDLDQRLAEMNLDLHQVT